MRPDDVGLVVYVWLSLAVWRVVFGSFGRTVGWIATALIVWFLGHAGLTINTLGGVRAVAAAVTAVGIMGFWRRRVEIKKEWRKSWVRLVVGELLFAGGLIWLTGVRAHNPDILDLEKFMDAGFIQGYLRSPRLPMEDMWLAGETVNYYTFGHFMGAVLTQMWGIDLAYSYNLLLGVIMGLVMAGVFEVVVRLSGSHPGLRTIIGGVVGALLVGWGGNSQTVWYWLKNQSWQGYWYADATRFIYNTIHEFPAYSFVVSDLHGHVWDLPVVLLFLYWLIKWFRGMHPRSANHKISGSDLLHQWRRPAALLLRSHPEIGMGVLLGVMVMTNTWDVLIYGMVVGVVGMVAALSYRVLTSWGVMGATAVLVALPWMLNFQSIDQGVRLVEMRTPLWQLAVLWSGHLAITLIALGSITNFEFLISKQNKLPIIKFQIQNILVFALAVGAVVLLIIPELVYVKDIYPSHPRANTMFKLTYQAFILMSIIAGWMVANLHPRGVKSRFALLHTPGVLKAVVVLIVGGLLVFPYFAYRDYYGGLKTYRGLDGLAWMARDDPGSYQAISWLKRNVEGRPVVLEAVGESYTQNGRISVFSGLPTVLGWRVHEWLWRGGFEIPAQRTEEVKKIYEEPNTKGAKEIIEKYKIRYIIIGRLEREGYQVAERSLERLGRVVFEAGETEIIQINF